MRHFLIYLPSVIKNKSKPSDFEVMYMFKRLLLKQTIFILYKDFAFFSCTELHN